MKVYQRIALAINAQNNCIQSGNVEWQNKWGCELESLAENYLPSGSGFDSGTTINLEESRDNRIVLDTSYHHMDEGGYYCGWSDHSIIVTPSLVFGFDLRVTGRNVRDIKDYIAETFQLALDLDYPTD